jgi:hypothetical protein
MSEEKIHPLYLESGTINTVDDALARIAYMNKFILNNKDLLINNYDMLVSYQNEAEQILKWLNQLIKN